MEIFSNARRPHAKKEKLSNKSRVQVAGYASTKKRITDFLRSGMRLQAAREEQFDSDKGPDADHELQEDPTRSPGYEFSDAVMDARMVRDRIQKQAMNAKRKGKDTPPVSNDLPEAGKQAEKGTKAPDTGK